MASPSNAKSDFDPANILLVQLGDIGDVVLTAPTIKAVKEAYPNARVSILVFKPYGSLLAADPNLAEIVEFTKSRGSLIHVVRETLAFARQLRQRRYTLVIDLRTGDRGAIVSYLTGAPTRVGYRGEKSGFWQRIAFTRILHKLTPAGLPAHPGADQCLRVVRELGIDTADSIPKLFIASGDLLRAKELFAEAGLDMGRAVITANPYSRWKYKEWDDSKWGEVIDRIWEACRLPTVLVGAKEEAPACQEIVAGREGRVINLAGRTTLGELAAVISLGALHMGVDSAAPHIAAATDTATVTIHGPSDWRAWRIVSDTQKVVCAAMDCLPCNKTGCDGNGISLCLDALGADEVTDAVLKLLGSPLMKLDQIWSQKN